MGQLEDMQMFIRVVEAGGIGRAAEQLGLAKSAVSRRLSDLEQRLGSRLMNRTTRKSSLTENGRQYYQRALTLIDYVDELHQDLEAADTAAKGHLRIAVPLSFGLMHLTSAIDEFTQQNPELTVQIDFSDRMVDVVEEGFDLVLRIGALKDSTMQAKKIAAIHHVLVATQDYLKNHAVLAVPEDLKQHRVLKYDGSRHALWQLTGQAGEHYNLNLDAKMSANNGDFLKAMALGGHGVTSLPTFLVWKELASGELVRILEGFDRPSSYAYALYPQNRYLPKRARLFIDFMAQRFGDQPYWDKALKAL